MWVSSGSGEEKRVAFQAAGRRHSEPFSDGAHRGYLIRLSRFPQSDLEVGLVLALDPERTLQQVAYANGVKADFDLAKGLCRVQGVSGFSGEWEKPHRGQL